MDTKDIRIYKDQSMIDDNDNKSNSDIIYVVSWAYLFIVGITGIFLNVAALIKAMKVKKWLDKVLEGSKVIGGWRSILWMILFFVVGTKDATKFGDNKSHC